MSNIDTLNEAIETLRNECNGHEECYSCPLLKVSTSGKFISCMLDDSADHWDDLTENDIKECVSCKEIGYGATCSVCENFSEWYR